jgi:hypothetical protein
MMEALSMEEATTGQHDLILRVTAYQEASNSYNIDAAVAMFAPGGSIEVGGKRYAGPDALRATHEYDMASKTQVAFSDFDLEGDMVRCAFHYCDELDRVVGLDGTTSKAEFSFQHSLIQAFVCLPASDEEMRRHREAKAPFYRWVRENYPEEVAKGFAFDYESGASLFKVARAWHDSRQE